MNNTINVDQFFNINDDNTFTVPFCKVEEEVILNTNIEFVIPHLNTSKEVMEGKPGFMIEAVLGALEHIMLHSDNPYVSRASNKVREAINIILSEELSNNESIGEHIDD